MTEGERVSEGSLIAYSDGSNLTHIYHFHTPCIASFYLGDKLVMCVEWPL